MNHDLVNEIRSKVDIIDIIGERIPLVARGKNFFCVCPFHDFSGKEKARQPCVSQGLTGLLPLSLLSHVAGSSMKKV